MTYYLPTGNNCANSKPPHEGIVAFAPEYIGDTATLSLYIKIIDEQNKRVFRMFILTILLIVVIMIEASYIVYDIKKDSEFEIETTVTEVYQDSPSTTERIQESIMYSKTVLEQ